MFRNLSSLVVLLVVCLLCPALCVAAEEPAGFTAIFDGQSLDGWDGNSQFWSVEDGAITGRTTKENPTKGNTFIIWRHGVVDDFHLRLAVRITGGNSGIQYRSRELSKWVVGGYQGDFEAGDRYSGILYEERGTRGVMAERGEKVVFDADGKRQVVEKLGDAAQIGAVIKKEDWNDYEIVAQGGRLIHKINGVTTIDVTDQDPGKQVFSGILALQLHAGPPMTVQFKDIQLKRLKLTGPDRKKIVLVAGRPSHAKGAHEFNAGSLLLKKCLDENVPQVLTAIYHNGWPKDPTAFDNADAIVLYMDGGGRHPLVQEDRLATIGTLMKQGVGLGCLHYAVEVPRDNGGAELLQWIGGYYETGFSTNPHWGAEFKVLPHHPITRGVEPFTLNDEWYFNIRFRPALSGVLPILKATPPDDKRKNEASKEFAGREEIVAWCTERRDGGRGFGFTGGHFHRGWEHASQRKLVLNALLWIAGSDVPDSGIASQLSPKDLEANLDPK